MQYPIIRRQFFTLSSLFILLLYSFCLCDSHGAEQRADNKGKYSLSELILIPDSFSVIQKSFPEQDDFAFAIKKGKLKMAKLDVKHLQNLSDEKIISLLDFLSKQKIKIQLKRGDGKTISWNLRHHLFLNNKKVTNGATSLALMFALQKEDKAFARLLTLGPDYFIDDFTKIGKSALSSGMLAQALSQLILEPVPHIPECDKSYKNCDSNGCINQHALLIKSRVQLASLLVKTYLSYWSKKDPNAIINHLKEMSDETKKIIQNKRDQNNPLTSTEAGRLMGSILAGAFQYSNELKEADEKRLEMIGAVFDVIGALTSFLGMIPLSSIASAAVGATSATALAIGGGIFNCRIESRDWTQHIVEFEGHQETILREQTQRLVELSKISEDPTDERGSTERNKKLSKNLYRELQKEFDELRITLHLNGLKD